MDPELCIRSRSAEETKRLGARLGAALLPGDVVGLTGPLGAGKTCLVQGIARGLGVDPRIPVTSPTFTLVGEYPGRVPLRHVDFYRVEDARRLEDAGFPDLFDGKGVVVVEWWERFPMALGPDRLEVQLDIEAPSERRLLLRGHGKRATERVRGIVEGRCR